MTKFHSAYGNETSTRRALYETLVGGRFQPMRHNRAPKDSKIQIFNLPQATEVATENFKQGEWTEFAVQ